jgi:hypothetical protein
MKKSKYSGTFGDYSSFSDDMDPEENEGDASEAEDE